MVWCEVYNFTQATSVLKLTVILVTLIRLSLVYGRYMIVCETPFLITQTNLVYQYEHSSHLNADS